MKYSHIIAIDPDTEKSGIAHINLVIKKGSVESMTFPSLIDFLKSSKKLFDEAGQSMIVVVEAGWLNAKSNFGGYGRKGSKAAGERIAKNVGANHQTGKHIVEMCRHYGIEVREARPLKKCWAGPSGKITQKEIEAITGITGRMGQDSRDALLLAWNFAGLPIKLPASLIKR